MIVVFKFRGVVNVDYCIIVGVEIIGFVCVVVLFFYCGFKISFINFDVVFVVYIGGQVDWEVVGVVQMEGGFVVQGVVFQF